MKIERSIGVAATENERTLTEDCFCFSLSGYLKSELSCCLTVGDPKEKSCKMSFNLPLRYLVSIDRFQPSLHLDQRIEVLRTLTSRHC
jgi:hypothetical protein